MFQHLKHMKKVVMRSETGKQGGENAGEKIVKNTVELLKELY